MTKQWANAPMTWLHFAAWQPLVHPLRAVRPPISSPQNRLRAQAGFGARTIGPRWAGERSCSFFLNESLGATQRNRSLARPHERKSFDRSCWIPQTLESTGPWAPRRPGWKMPQPEPAARSSVGFVDNTLWGGVLGETHGYRRTRFYRRGGPCTGALYPLRSWA